MWRSVPQTPQAAMRMSAALGGTSGFGTSRRTGGSPGPSKVATRTFGMDPPNGKRKGASTALPRAATVIRGKIHNGYNPVNPLRRAMASRSPGGCRTRLCQGTFEGPRRVYLHRRGVRWDIYCCQSSGYKY